MGFLAAFLAAIGRTVTLTLVSSALVVPCSFLLGLMLLARRRFPRAVARVYIVFFRGTSIVVQLFWAFYVLPYFGIELSPFATAVLVIVAQQAALGAEIVRAGFRGIAQSQIDAVTVLNFKPFDKYFRMLLPEALTIMLPAFNNIFIGILKVTAICSLITIPETTKVAMTTISLEGHATAILSAVLVTYLVLALCITASVRIGERRLEHQLGRRGVAVSASRLGRIGLGR